VPEQNRSPLRGEIWFVKLPTDPPEKNPRPLVVVSRDERNKHEKANTVMVVPLTTTDIPTF
jgi:mRNA-degrading endonuclease toxin of MazEF toxin-antitoxin module